MALHLSRVFFIFFLTTVPCVSWRSTNWWIHHIDQLARAPARVRVRWTSTRRGQYRESMGRGQCRCIADKKAEASVLTKMPAASMVSGRTFLRGWTIDLVGILRKKWTIDLLSISRYFNLPDGGWFSG